MAKKVIIIGSCRKDVVAVEVDARSMPEHEVIAEGEKYMRIYGMKIADVTVVDGVALADPEAPKRLKMVFRENGIKVL